MRTYVVLGGGFFGTLQLTHLQQALASGRLAPGEVWLVDCRPDPPALRASRAPVRFVQSSWRAFLHRELSHLEGDLLLPPYADHLLADYLADSLSAAGVRVTVQAPPALPAFPFSVVRDEVAYVSYATWRCPTTCRAPARCPATRAPRDWDLPDALRRYGQSLGAAVVVFESVFCLPYVETVPVAAAQVALANLARAAPGSVLVATASACHGAVSWLTLAGRQDGTSERALEGERADTVR